MQGKEKGLEIVCVSNDPEIYDRVIKSNPNINKYHIEMYDNTLENVGIPERYNSYIEKRIKAKSDFWVVFCHQDFGLREDPLKKLNSLSKKSIYGAIGIQHEYSIIKAIKVVLSKRLGYYPSIRINVRGLNPLNKVPLIVFLKESMSDFLSRRRICLGEIGQGNNNFEFRKIGKKLKKPEKVLNLDCCCLIVHSSLIYKHKLRFDENLDWHMYVEDFCINCQQNFGIESKAIQLDCYHLGTGNFNEDFYKCAKYVKDKYGLKSLKTTCIDD